MAKKKVKIWSAEELILTFHLERKDDSYFLLSEWLDAQPTPMVAYEQALFNQLLSDAKKGANFWNEETLKMRFISPLLTVLIQIDKDYQNRSESFYDKEISATVEGIYLQTETDFMLAKGIGDIAQTPYFHFQVGGTPQYKCSRKSPLNLWLNL